MPANVGTRSLGEKGSVLVMVLVMVTIGAGLAVYIVGLSKVTLMTASALQDKAEAKLEAESQLERLKYLLSTGRYELGQVRLTDGTPAADSLRSLPLSGDEFSLGKSRITLVDTAGRFSLAGLDTAILKRLVIMHGGQPDQAARVADSYRDWVDQDDFKRLNGAEAYYYQTMPGQGYRPRNSRDLQAVEELRLLRGMDNQLFDKLRNALVSFGGGTFNLNSASVETLSAKLDISQRQAEQLVVLRKSQGRVSRANLLAVTGRTYANQLEELVSHPGRGVEISIQSKVGAAVEKLSATLNFKATDEVPYTLVRYRQ